MVSIPVVCFSAFLFVVLGAAWLKGVDVVRQQSPQSLPKFYMAFAAFRVVTVLAYAAVYIFFISQSLGQSKAFVAMLFAMYVVMMAVTLWLKH